jgi:hypothetical protein
MSKPRVFAALSLALLLALPLGCELLQPKVSSDMLEAELIKWLAGQGLTASEATCPDNQKLEKGNVLECTCKVDGVEIPVRVEVTDPLEGTVEWEPKYTTVKKAQLEESIRELPDLTGKDIVIDCHKQVFVSIPNSKVECDLTNNDSGEAFVAELEFSDGAGNYALQLNAKPG